MTKKEKQTVRWCIDQILAEDGDFTSGVGLLCEMVGWEYPLYSLLKSDGLVAATVPEIMAKLKGNATEFSVEIPDRTNKPKKPKKAKKKL